MYAKLIMPGMAGIDAEAGDCIGVGINPDPGNPKAHCWLGYLPGWVPE